MKRPIRTQTIGVVESLRKSGSAHNLAHGKHQTQIKLYLSTTHFVFPTVSEELGLRKSGSSVSLASSYGNISRSDSYHKLARRDSQGSLLVAAPDSQGMSVPLIAASMYGEDESGEDVSAGIMIHSYCTGDY